MHWHRGLAGLQGHAEALHVFTNDLNDNYRSLILDFAAKNGLPVTADRRFMTEPGAVMIYQYNFSEMWRRVARFVDKILKAARPVVLPVKQPTKPGRLLA